MAPEYPYPQPINDCYAVTLHVIENCAQLGGDLNKLVLAGDSAGRFYLKNNRDFFAFLIFSFRLTFLNHYNIFNFNHYNN